MTRFQLLLHRWGFLVLLCLSGLVAKAADSTPQPPPNPGPKATNSVESLNLAEENYRLRSGDVIELRVYQEDDLNTRTKVDSDGFVLLPLIGRVAVRGETIAAATTLIRKRLEADYLHQARVSLLVAERAPERFLMMGQVNRPGVYDIPSGEQIDLIRAIAMAGGFTKIASPGKVTVKRMNGRTEEILRLNAKTLSRGTTEPPFVVQADDQISVGESAF